MNDSFITLCEICKKTGWATPVSEEVLLSNSEVLDCYIDDLLVQELISCGLNDNDEPNQYGIAIEKVIDYFNKFRL